MRSKLAKFHTTCFVTRRWNVFFAQIVSVISVTFGDSVISSQRDKLPFLLSHASLSKLISNWRIQLIDPSPNNLFETFDMVELSCFIVIYLSYHFEKEVEYDSSCFQLKTKLQAFTTQLVTDLNPIYGQCYAICYAQLWYAISARWGNASQRNSCVTHFGGSHLIVWYPKNCLIS